jgi:hypothetical protein
MVGRRILKLESIIKCKYYKKCMDSTYHTGKCIGKLKFYGVKKMYCGFSSMGYNIFKYVKVIRHKK